MMGFLVDNEDKERIKNHSWHLQNGYLVHSIGTKSSKKNVQMHHFLIGQPLKPFVVDHINRNPLDNRKQNLRIVSRTVNQMNRGKFKNNTSGMPGVHWVRSMKRWRVHDLHDKYVTVCVSKTKAFKIRRGIYARGI